MLISIEENSDSIGSIESDIKFHDMHHTYQLGHSAIDINRVRGGKTLDI